jgi:hypothetical protein
MKYAEEFKARLLDPEAWQQTARQLLEAAALLEPKINEFWQNMRSQSMLVSTSWRSWNDEFIAIYFMLCAFAIENLLKGQIIRTNQVEICALIEGGSALPKFLKGHDLYKLTLDAGFPELAKYDEGLLRRLSRCSVWYGRYPIPITPAALKRTQSSTNYDFDLSLTQYTSFDREEIQRIVQELTIPVGEA